MIASYKHSSLLGFVVSDEGKKFYNIDNMFKFVMMPQIVAVLDVIIQMSYLKSRVT